MAAPRVESFGELGLDEWIVLALREMSITVPTPVQAGTIPQILQGKDVIGAAQTGSGKTAAFMLPILQRLFTDPYGVYAVVLTPTRELACQIADQVRVFGRPAGVRVCTVVGGLSMHDQSVALQKRPHVIVATPGRLEAHLRSATPPSLGRVRFLVLDEADRLLEDGFAGSIQCVVDAVPPPARRQTLLFSATMTPDMDELAHLAIREPYKFSAQSHAFETVKKLQQEYLFVPLDVKDAYLWSVVSEYEDKNMIIFAASVEKAQLLCESLRQLDKDVVALHSGYKQKQRLAALQLFKDDTVKILVATDVASRGLDIPVVDMVVNYDVPRDPADYVHRVGRTARAGKGGLAITLVSQYDISLVHSIEEKIERKLEEHTIDEDAVLTQLDKVSRAVSEARLFLTETGFMERMERRRDNKRAARERQRALLRGEDAGDAKKEKKKKKKEKKTKSKKKRKRAE